MLKCVVNSNTRQKYMAKTTIEWTDFTWNPFVGCKIVSAGCTNCYAMRMARRLEGFGVEAYKGTTQPSKAGAVWTGLTNRSSDAVMRKPLSLHKPTLIFVNSMSDFWNPDAKDEWRAEAIDIMWQTPRHEYQVLTKRPEHIRPIMQRMDIDVLPPNFWLGATVEDHRVVNRIDLLREVEAEVRFLSVEPMTAPLGQVDLTGIHWVITGGESGPGARPMKADWVREVRDQCVAAGVPHFFKQFGKPQNNPLWAEAVAAGLDPALHVKHLDPDGKGGSLLDGVAWKEYPRLPGHGLLKSS